MSAEVALDASWCAAHPLPPSPQGGKEERGRVLIVGGSVTVPGATALAFEAALRTGAGKVQIATVESVALPLGISLPEAGLYGLPEDEDGEIGAVGKLNELVARCDSVVVGCGMETRNHTADIVLGSLANLPRDAAALVDAGALTALAGKPDRVSALGAPLVFTPHHGELALLMGTSIEAVHARPLDWARRAAAAFGATVVLKDQTTYVVLPNGNALRHDNETGGLGTAGSGDVLTGVIGALLCMELQPYEAAAWGVALHANAGEACSRRIGPVGYLARELPRELPALLASARPGRSG